MIDGEHSDVEGNICSPFGVILQVNLEGRSLTKHLALIKRLFIEQGLLIFPGQHLTAAQQVRVTALVGEGKSSNVRITNISNDPMQGTLGHKKLGFHFEGDYDSFKQGTVISLFGKSVPVSTTATLFANGELAAASLSKRLRKKIESRKVRQVFQCQNIINMGANQNWEWWPNCIKDVIKKHPIKGTEVLAPSDLHSLRLENPVEHFRSEILARTLHHYYQQKHIYEHRWNQGDLIIWDNTAIQHSRGEIEHNSLRLLRRAQLFRVN